MLGGDLGIVFQNIDCIIQFPGGLPEDVDHLFDMVVSLHLINFHFIHGRIGIVHHIVYGTGELKNILPVDRRDKRLVQFLDQNSPQLIGLPFNIADQIGVLLAPVFGIIPEGLQPFNTL